jgi:hypothetical protein
VAAKRLALPVSGASASPHPQDSESLFSNIFRCGRLFACVGEWRPERHPVHQWLVGFGFDRSGFRGRPVPAVDGEKDPLIDREHTKAISYKSNTNNKKSGPAFAGLFLFGYQVSA